MMAEKRTRIGGRKTMHGAAMMLDRVPIVTVTGRGRMVIENHRGIHSFSETCVCVCTCLGRIVCRGSRLTVEEMDDRELLVTGEIDSVDVTGLEGG